jgi:hypothetical protein
MPEGPRVGGDASCKGGQLDSWMAPWAPIIPPQGVSYLGPRSKRR